MKKRITALLLVLSLAALLSLSAFAEDASTTADPSVGAGASDTAGSGTTASGAVTITGEVYYGTDYVQFDIHGGSATNLFYDVLYGEETVYQHVHYTTSDGSGVNSVGIDLEDLGDDYSDVTQYSIRVYTGRAANDSNTIATATMAGIYARLNGNPQQDVLIGSVVNGTAVEGIVPPPTYYDQTTDTDYNLVSEGMKYDETARKYYAEYKPYVPTPLDGSITYVDNQGNILKTDTIVNITPDHTGDTPKEVVLVDRFLVQDGEQDLYYYPTVPIVRADYYGQIDFVVLCNALSLIHI